MKADIEKLLAEIGDDRHGLGDLIMHFGNIEEIVTKEWWEAPIETLRDILRNNVKQNDKESFILLAMGVGAIKNDTSKVSEY